MATEPQGRGGPGAVMGSKKLKAIVVKGSGKISVADPDKLKAVNQEILDTMKNGPMAQMVGGFSIFGNDPDDSGERSQRRFTGKKLGWCRCCGITVRMRPKTLTGAAMDPKYRVKKIRPAPIAPWVAVRFTMSKTVNIRSGETGRPEYETSSAFGSLMLNEDVEAMLKCNHICNLYGLDTISAGGTITMGHRVLRERHPDEKGYRRYRTEMGKRGCRRPGHARNGRPKHGFRQTACGRICGSSGQNRKGLRIPGHRQRYRIAHARPQIGARIGPYVCH